MGLTLPIHVWENRSKTIENNGSDEIKQNQLNKRRTVHDSATALCLKNLFSLKNDVLIQN